MENEHNTPLASVRYEFTLEEMADHEVSIYRRSRTGRRTRTRRAALEAIKAIVILLGFFFLTGRLSPLMATISLAGGIIAFVLSATLHWTMIRRHLKARLRERLPSGPMMANVEVRDDCIAVDQNGTQVVFRRDEVQEVIESGKYIEVILRTGGIRVPVAAFPDQDSRIAFVQTLRRPAELCDADHKEVH